MSKKNIFILSLTVVSFILYTIILSIIGVFGADIQEKVLIYTKTFLKFLFIFVGYFLAVFLPNRVYGAISLNKKRKRKFKKDMEFAELDRKTKEMERRILETYYKEEDIL